MGVCLAMSLVGRSLGKYKIVEEIGQGGMATVYRGYQASLNRYVAVKVLAGQLAKDKTFRQRFAREARAVAQLSHPNIVPIYDFGEEPSLEALYIVTELVEGGSLKDRLGQPLDVSTAIRITIDIANALDYAHRQGIIHRDVKPSNILLAKDGRAMLSDFGIARMIQETRFTQTGVSIGTPAYMSPEQAKGEELDGRSDIYSLGIVLYEMLTGKAPFEAETPVAVLHQQVYEPPLPPRRLNPRIPKKVEKVILKALAKDKRERFYSAGEMVSALQGAITPTPIPILSSLRRRAEAGKVGEPATIAAGEGAEGITQVAAPKLQALPDLGCSVLKVMSRLGKVSGKLLLKLGAWVLKTALMLAVILSIVAVILGVVITIGLSTLAERAVRSYDWHLEYLSTSQKNVINESDLQELASLGIEPYTLDSVKNLRIDLKSPYSIYISGQVLGRDLLLECRLEEEDGVPRFQLERINGRPLYIVGGALSEGINRGLKEVFKDAPAKIEGLRVTEQQIIIWSEGKGPKAELQRPTLMPIPTSTVPPTSTPIPTPSGLYYTVQPGDTLAKIAKRYGTSVEAIAVANSIADPSRIRVGQRLFIPQEPTPTPTYTPVPGQKELYYDDGGAELALVSSPGAVAAVRFHVPLESQVLRLKFHVSDQIKDVRVHVLDADFNSIYSQVVTPSSGWFEVDISDGKVFVNGDFYVGLEWISESSEGPWLSIDTSFPHHMESWLGTLGDKGDLKPDADYMIRAVVLIQESR